MQTTIERDEVITRPSDTNTFAAPGVPYVNRAPLTPEQLAAFKPKKNAKKSDDPEPLTKENLAKNLAYICGLPKDGAQLIAFILIEQNRRIERLEGKVKVLEGRITLARLDSEAQKT